MRFLPAAGRARRRKVFFSLLFCFVPFKEKPYIVVSQSGPTELTPPAAATVCIFPLLGKFFEMRERLALP